MKKPLRGWMILEDYADNMSHWDGVITGPDNPVGANLAWQNPIEMIQVLPNTISIRKSQLMDAINNSYKIDRENDLYVDVDEVWRWLSSHDKDEK